MQAPVELNSAQEEAVYTREGPTLVLAGPGSGKTRVLIHRVGYLIKELEVKPWRIMAVTFTNKAAREMKERLLAQNILTEAELREMTIGTFHAICARILRRDIEQLGNFSRSFIIFDSDDQLNVVKRILKEMNLDEKRYKPRSLQAAISNAKNELLTPEEYRPGDYWGEIVARVYEQYDTVLQQSNALDFDDLILKTYQLFKDAPDAREYYQARYEQVMVDEFQDTNLAQYNLVRQFSAQHRNLFVVGDEDQSIYSWRGADYRNVLRFRDDFPDAKTILLEQNYRSTETILKAAGSVIAQNAHRHPKTLFTERGQGQKVILVEAYNGPREATFVVEEIARLQRESRLALADVAVMYRTNAQSRVMEEAFLQAGLPYQLVRGVRFYERKEVKDALAYLRLVHNPSDSVALERVINVPTRGIGGKTLAGLYQWAAASDLTPWQALVRLHQIDRGEVDEPSPFRGRAHNSLVSFADIMLLLLAAKEKMSLLELIDLTLARSSYRDFLLDGSDEGEDRWENLQELKTVARSYNDMSGGEGLALFLEEVALVADIDGLEDDADRGVALLTLHTAKGLEFPVVFMVGMEDGLFPHSRSRDSIEELEEERRLAYVGITRAKNLLYLTRAFRRAIYGYDETPSRASPFLDDIPAEVLEIRQIDGRSQSRWENRQTRAEYQREQASRWSSSPSASRQPPRRASRSTRPTETAAPGDAAFAMGDPVQHPSFGKGTVISVAGSGEDAEITVAFPGKGIKKLLAGYLQPAA